MKSYAVMRSLNRRGVNTIVASDRERIPHFASRYCSEQAWLPSPENDLPGYKDRLLELARRPDVTTIVPVRECDVYLFAKYRSAFEDEVSLVAPDFETLRTGHDRYRLAKAARGAGVPTTDTRLLSEVDEWDTDVVVKSRYNILTDTYVDSYPANAVEEVKNVRFFEAGERPDAEAVYSEMGHDPVVQSYIPQADKILYCALWEDGEPLATYQHRQLRQNSWVGGGGVYRVSTHSDAVEKAAYDLLSHLDWTGFACIEYLQCEETGEWKFLEINPRIWQSMPEAVRAGSDFPAYYWLAATEEADRIDPEYETGQACHIAYGEVAHLLSVLRDDSPFLERPSFARTLWEIGKSCVTDPRFDYIRADDPKLFLTAMRETLTSGVSSSREFSNGNGHIRGSPSADLNDVK